MLLAAQAFERNRLEKQLLAAARTASAEEVHALVHNEILNILDPGFFNSVK